MLGMGSIDSVGESTLGVRVRSVAIGLLLVATAASCTSSKKPQAGPSPTGNALKVTSLTATPKSGGEVDLSWAGTGKGLYGYYLTRDGKYVNLVTSTTYTDYGVQPKHTYVYEVQPQEGSGSYAPGTSQTVTTPAAPPISNARFAGAFDTRFVYLAETYTNRHVGEKYGEKWMVNPHCPTGTCSVTLLVERSGARPASLHRAGATYRGGATDTFAVCHGNRIREQFTVTLQITKARYLHGVWRVAAFTGTQTQSAPAAFGCISSSSRTSIVAHLI